jgi:hypothetical protein
MINPPYTHAQRETEREKSISHDRYTPSNYIYTMTDRGENGLRDSLTYFNSALREILELQKARKEMMNQIYPSMQDVEKGGVAKTEEKGSVAATDDTMMDTCVFLTNSSRKKILRALENERKLDTEKKKLEERKKMQEDNEKNVNAIRALQKKKAKLKEEVETVK